MLKNILKVLFATQGSKDLHNKMKSFTIKTPKGEIKIGPGNPVFIIAEMSTNHHQDYEKALKVQINSIRDKYVKPEKGTTEFALLFIPSESIYYETIAEKNYMGDPCQINEYATKNKVIPVSPNTFYAFLNVVMLGIRNIEIVKEAKPAETKVEEPKAEEVETEKTKPGETTTEEITETKSAGEKERASENE